MWRFRSVRLVGETLPHSYLDVLGSLKYLHGLALRLTEIFWLVHSALSVDMEPHHHHQLVRYQGIGLENWILGSIHGAEICKQGGTVPFLG